jgi:hypothetical protein
MRDLVEEFSFGENELKSFWPYEYSERRRDRLLEYYKSWSDRLDGMAFPADADDALDYHLLGNYCQNESREVSRNWERMGCLKAARPALLLLELEDKRRVGEIPDGRECARLLTAAAKELAELREDLPSPEDALLTTRLVSCAREAIERWFGSAYGYDPEKTWWMKEPKERLEDELEKTLEALIEASGQKGEWDDPLVGSPVGRDAIEEMIEAEELPVGIDQMIDIGEKHAAWCREEIARAAQELGLSTWQEGVTAMMEDCAPPGEQDQLAWKTAREIIDFVEARDLVTVPDIARETWRIDMSPLELQRTMPFSPYGGQYMITAYPLDTMDHETKTMSFAANNRGCLRLVTPHELIPGHHLQLTQSRLLRPYRRLFSTPFFVEGWTLHWEMLQWELGWARTPLERIGMLWWRLHRCMRIVVSLKYHVGEMSADEMVQLLVEQGGQNKHSATGEVRRYIGPDYPPLYQCAYLIGGMMMHDLYLKLTGNGWTPKEFHNRVLSENGMNLWALRCRLKEEPFDRNEWKFWEWAPGLED